ncbi:MAG: hypothetical protein LBD27_01775 [Tannerella sp.]|jgi:hypothetical protein|nr:hypothetical protein [Tannerella sp.]
MNRRAAQRVQDKVRVTVLERLAKALKAGRVEKKGSMGKKGKIVRQVIYVLMAATALGCVAAYLVMRGERPWLAFYVACCGGVMIANLTILLLFMRRNMK